MTDSEKREAARQFINKWNGRGKENEDARSFWLDIFQRILGVEDATDRIEFEKKVIVDGGTKSIDAYIPETKVIIEQKSLGIALDKKGSQSGGIELTPYEQAKRYNDNLPSSEKARWIITSNFSEIWIYDMDTNEPEKNIIIITTSDLQAHYPMLDFLVSKKVKKITEEMELSLQAGELVGKIHDRFLEQYNDPMAKRTQNSLNILCVRLVFCLYAEDAGLFGSNRRAFSDYLAQYEPKDIRRALLDLFKVLDTPVEKREELYLDDDLASFPYVNGGLFARENIEIPKITQEIKDTLAESAHFNWSRISPTIFGAVFESTLNPETRRSGGMHYTSIENIHKVIDPLFLNDLKAELVEIKKTDVSATKKKKLVAFQNKLSSLKFLDPACGSGNFLTETYVSLRRLENEAIAEIYSGQIVIDEVLEPIKVDISQFYGIEINDFAVSVAKTALWIAECQMMQETEDVVSVNLDFLPLKTNAYIVEGNALELNWNHIVSASELNYIMGNPPFIGGMMMTREQKQEMIDVFGSNIKGLGELDYVAAWYRKAADLIRHSEIEVAFVSTNSITQGEQATILWEELINEGITINFAHQTFQWDSEANIKAHVHVVIIGFSFIPRAKKIIYGKDFSKQANNINAYLVDAPYVFIHNLGKPLCDAPAMNFGNMPRDGGGFILSEEEKNDLIKNEPLSEKWIHLFLGSTEFINNKKRYCLWLVDAKPNELSSCPTVLKRVKQVKEMRLESKASSTRKMAETPTLFAQITQPVGTPFLLVPRVSSERRRYVPMGFLSGDVISSDAVQIIPDATIYHFGVLTSNVHMAWMRAVCGRLKSDYRYSKDIVYNNFPWCNPTPEQKAKIEQTAQAILDARALYPDCSLADLYDELTMPPELRKAHQQNDRAVMEAYGLDVKTTSEADCVAFLMKRYQELIKQP